MKILFSRFLSASLAFQMIALPYAQASRAPSFEQVVQFLTSGTSIAKVQTAVEKEGMEFVDAQGRSTTMSELVRVHASTFAILSADKRYAFRVRYEMDSNRSNMKLSLVDRDKDPTLSMRIPGSVVAATTISAVAGENATQMKLRTERALKAFKIQITGLIQASQRPETSKLTQLLDLLVPQAHASMDTAKVVAKVLGIALVAICTIAALGSLTLGVLSLQEAITTQNLGKRIVTGLVGIISLGNAALFASGVYRNSELLAENW